jgi:hypothetical protein
MKDRTRSGVPWRCSHNLAGIPRLYRLLDATISSLATSKRVLLLDRGPIEPLNRRPARAVPVFGLSRKLSVWQYPGALDNRGIPQLPPDAGDRLSVIGAPVRALD